MNWITIFGLVLQFGSAILADAVAIEGDQPVQSPPIVPTLEGHKYSLVLALTPVAGQARGPKQTLNWITIFGLVIQEGSALLADAEEIAADQAFSTPTIDVTLAGYKYTAVITGTPVA